MPDGFKLDAAARASFVDAFTDVIGRRFPGRRIIVGWKDEASDADVDEKEAPHDGDR